MSHTTIYKFPAEGPAEEFESYRNAFLSAMAIWLIAAENHLGISKENSAGFIFTGGVKKMMALIEDKTKPAYLRAVIASTADKALVKRENFQKLAAHFREFQAKEAKDRATHCIAQAETLEAMLKDPTAVAAGWQQTSAGPDVWEVLDPKTQEHRNYDLSKDSGHWFIYDEIKE